MANVQKTVDIIFGGKNEVGKVIDSIGRDFSAMGSSITSVTQPLSNMANNILMLDAALTALAIGGMAYSIKKFGEFQGGFAEITTLIAATGAPIEKLREQIINYGGETTQSLSEVNKAIYAAVSAGVDYTKSVEFVAQAEKLAVAGRADLGSTTKTLISTLNAYGASTDEAEKYSDALFTTVRLGQTTLPELNENLGKLTGIAASAGIPFDTLAAAIAAMTVQGLDTTIASTALRAAITGIISPSSEAAKAAKAMGLDFSISAVQSKGFEAVLLEVAKATGGNIEKVESLFGNVRGLVGVLSLATDGSTKFHEALGEMEKKGGATSIAYGKMVGEFENINQRVINSFDILLITLGKEIFPQYEAGADAVKDIFKNLTFAVNQGAFAPLIEFIQQMGTALAEKLAVIAKNLPAALEGIDFSKVVASLGSLGTALAEAFETVFGDIDFDTAEGLHIFIQRVIDAFGKLIDVTHGIIDGMAPLWAMLGKLTSGFEGLDGQTAEAIGRVLGAANAIQVLADNSGALIAVLGLLTGTHIANLIRDFGRLGGVILGTIPGLTSFMATLGGWGTAGALGVAAGVGVLTGSLLNQIPVVGQASQGFLKLLDVNDNYFGALGKSKEEMTKINREFETAVAKNKALADGQTYTAGTTEKSTTSTSTLTESLKAMGYTSESAHTKLLAMSKTITAIPEKKTTTVEVLADGTSIETTKDMIYKTFPDGSTLITNIGTKANLASLDATKKTIEEKIPPEKVMEIQAKIDIAKLHEQSAIVQKSIEWKAKIDIAQIEAATATIKANFASIDNTISSTGKLLETMWGVYSKFGGGSFIETQIEAEGRRRDEALQMQKELTVAQVDLIKAQTTSLKEGNAMIQIDGKGLQPHLEAFMFEILAAIQVKANAQGMKLLVGV